MNQFYRRIRLDDHLHRLREIAEDTLIWSRSLAEDGDGAMADRCRDTADDLHNLADFLADRLIVPNSRTRASGTTITKRR